jgi:hypothetical protein
MPSTVRRSVHRSHARDLPEGLRPKAAELKLSDHVRDRPDIIGRDGLRFGSGIHGRRDNGFSNSSQAEWFRGRHRRCWRWFRWGREQRQRKRHTKISRAVIIRVTVCRHDHCISAGRESIFTNRPDLFNEAVATGAELFHAKLVLPVRVRLVDELFDDSRRSSFNVK